MKIPSFQYFLEEYWMENLAEGQTKDQSIEATDRWIEQLEVQELIDFGELYGQRIADIKDVENAPKD